MISGMENRKLVADCLQEAAQLWPDQRFVQCGGDWMSYGEIEEQVGRLAGGLQAFGVAPGERMGLVLPNRIEFITSIFACAKLGAIQVPINVYLRGEFLRHQLEESGVSTLVVDGPGLALIAPLLPQLPELRSLVLVDDGEVSTDRATARYADLEKSDPPSSLPRLRPSDPCNILYTSGTTGPSKGCILTHAYYTFIPQAFQRAGWIQNGDTIFGALPLFHASGQIWMVMAALSVGGAVVVEPSFSASTYMSRARETRATVTFGAGAMGVALLASAPEEHDRNHELRSATFMPMTETDKEKFRKRFGIPVNSAIYGQSELWPATIAPADAIPVPGSAGRVAPHVELRVVDDEDYEVAPGEVGEIVVRSKEPYTMFQGYWNNPEATLQVFRNLWHHTGDFGRLDDDGNLFFVDRKKDSLRRRGENVSSLELEQAIMAHEGIAMAAVHAVPSELGEDDIKACIVPTTGSDLLPEELFEFFRRSLPYYAIPRYVELMEELPLTPSMRVRKFLLRERGITDATWDLERLGLVVQRAERRTTWA